MKMLPHSDPVHKISIVSRGMALGYTMPLPEEDHLLYGRNKFLDELAGLLGGRVAEEEVFGDITTGASNDLERVTSLARRMVTQYGMSDVLGPQTFGEKEELVFLGREIGEQRNYSEEVAEAIDTEVRRLVREAHDRAREIVRTYRAKLDELANRLIEKETVDAAEFAAMFASLRTRLLIEAGLKQESKEIHMAELPDRNLALDLVRVTEAQRWLPAGGWAAARRSRPTRLRSTRCASS